MVLGQYALVGDSPVVDLRSHMLLFCYNVTTLFSKQASVNALRFYSFRHQVQTFLQKTEIKSPFLYNI
jgi:hypothetical protein